MYFIESLFLCTEIYGGNYTEELGPDAQLDFLDTQSPLEIGKASARCLHIDTTYGIIRILYTF